MLRDSRLRRTILACLFYLSRMAYKLFSFSKSLATATEERNSFIVFHWDRWIQNLWPLNKGEGGKWAYKAKPHPYFFLEKLFTENEMNTEWRTSLEMFYIMDPQPRIEKQTPSPLGFQPVCKYDLSIILPRLLNKSAVNNAV